MSEYRYGCASAARPNVDIRSRWLNAHSCDTHRRIQRQEYQIHIIFTFKLSVKIKDFIHLWCFTKSSVFLFNISFNLNLSSKWEWFPVCADAFVVILSRKFILSNQRTKLPISVSKILVCNFFFLRKALSLKINEVKIPSYLRIPDMMLQHCTIAVFNVLWQLLTKLLPSLSRWYNLIHVIIYNRCL